MKKLRVKLILLDDNEYDSIQGGIITRKGFCSYDIGKKAPKFRKYSNGWCHTTEVKVCGDIAVARIANEVTPRGVYTGLIIEAPEYDAHRIIKVLRPEDKCDHDKYTVMAKDWAEVASCARCGKHFKDVLNDASEDYRFCPNCGREVVRLGSTYGKPVQF